MTNDKNVIIDTISGIVSGFCVAPFVTIIDKSITKNASGASTLFKSINTDIFKNLRTPIKFCKGLPFLCIWGLYSATYATANYIDSYCKKHNINSDVPKFIGVGSVNASLSILKDRSFARMFGTCLPTKIPLISYGLWAVRDMSTIVTSFNVPSKLADVLEKKGYSKKVSMNSAQVFCPVVMQTITTPLHLLGLDYYNNRGKMMNERFKFIRKEYGKTTFARMCRIAPAFGFGGIINNNLKNYLYNNF